MTTFGNFQRPHNDDAGGGPAPAKPRKLAGNPGRRASQPQVTERTIFTAQMLARRLNKYEIKQFLKKKYGIGGRQCEAYISRGGST